MNMNILRYSLIDIAGVQEVDHTYVNYLPSTIIALNLSI